MKPGVEVCSMKGKGGLAPFLPAKKAKRVSAKPLSV